jgi:hypothetical protein
MDALLEYLARHPSILWILVGVGVFNLLLATLFYRPMLYFTVWFLRIASRVSREADRRQATTMGSRKSRQRVLRWYRRHYRSAWMQLLTIAYSLVLLGLAIAGLLLL